MLSTLKCGTSPGLGRYVDTPTIFVQHSDRFSLIVSSQEIEKGAYNVLLTSPEQCRPLDGHTTPLSRLLFKSPGFVRRVCHLVADESHLIYLWGTPVDGEFAFRPAWGRVSAIRTSLKINVPLLLLSATLSPGILEYFHESLSLRSPILYQSTVNRSNQTFAVHPIHGTFKDFRNLQMLVPPDILALDSISIDALIKRTTKTVIFIEDSNLIANAPDALYALFPSWIRPSLLERGFIRFYHAGMSKGYLDETYDAFESPNGDCKILFASSALAQVRTLHTCLVLVV